MYFSQQQAGKEDAQQQMQAEDGEHKMSQCQTSTIRYQHFKKIPI